jgi:hypothetical protein
MDSAGMLKAEQQWNRGKLVPGWDKIQEIFSFLSSRRPAERPGEGNKNILKYFLA